MEPLFLIIIIILIVQGIAIIFKRISEFFANVIAYFNLLRINKKIQVLEKSNDIKSAKSISCKEKELKRLFFTEDKGVIGKNTQNNLRDIFLIKDSIK